MLSEEMQEKVLTLAKEITEQAIKYIQELLRYSANTDAVVDNQLEVKYPGGITLRIDGNKYGVDFSKMTPEERNAFAASVMAVSNNIDIEQGNVVPKKREEQKDIETARPEQKKGQRMSMDEVEKKYTNRAAERNNKIPTPSKVHNRDIVR